MADFRLAYLHEARKCFRAMHDFKIERPEFWANLLGGVANASIASVPDSVVAEFFAEQERTKALRQHILDKLDGP